MRDSIKAMGLLLATLVAGPALAQEQDIPFQTLHRGVGAFGLPAGNHVIRSQEEFAASGLTQLLPPSALIGIDFDQQSVLAVLMGYKSTGGYSIEISEIERHALPQPQQPGHGGPPRHEMTIGVVRSSPPPGSAVTKALTAPFHMVTVAKVDPSDVVTWIDLPVPNKPQLLNGRVQVNGAEVLIKGSHVSHSIQDANMIRLLRNWGGRTVRVYGVVTGDATTEASPAFEISEISYPRPVRRQLAEVKRVGNRAKLNIGSGAEEVGVLGPVERLLRLRANGHSVVVDGYMFTVDDKDGTPRELYATSVEGRATRYSSITYQGEWRGLMFPGMQVGVERLSRSGRYARIRVGDVFGYVRVNRLMVGDEFAIQPLSGPEAGSLHGAVQGTVQEQ